MGEELWKPSPETRQVSHIGTYLEWLEATDGLTFRDYRELWEWSTEHLEDFWQSIWRFFEIKSEAPYTKVLDALRMPGAHWFQGSRLNYAEHALRRSGKAIAIYGRSQSRSPVDLSFDELRGRVGRVRVGLQKLGIRPGDVVAAYLPNTPEAVIASLATASLGAIWSSCAPEFGVKSVIDRFSQITPKILLTVDGYRYGDRVVDRRSEVREIVANLASLRQVVLVPHLNPLATRSEGYVLWDELIRDSAPMQFDQVPFDHPLYVLFSSGTTGLPKPIIHGHGGLLIEHLKVMSFHQDVGLGDTLFQVSTTGWMMWNFMIGALLTGASIVCFDGDVNYPDSSVLWQLVAELGVTNFGTSAAYLTNCRRLGINPGADADLSGLRVILSTGSPLPAETYRWVYRQVSDKAMLFSGSGGTDVCTGFVMGCPLLPVVAGEISGRCLGVKVESFDVDGRPQIGREGELVVTAPMPSMPLGFWNDPDGSKLRAAYFEMYPGVWRHGDWLTITERGTCIISGRSDSTLNRAGVRMGTAEFYDVVERLEEVNDSLVVHLEDTKGGPGQLVLFVALTTGSVLDDELIHRLKKAIREDLSPRHVPDHIFPLASVPRTLTGKKLEVPVKRLLLGESVETVASRGSITNADALDAIATIAKVINPSKSSP